MKHIFKIGAVFMAMLTISACNNEEFFELTNPPESPWPSLADFEKAPIGAYYGISGNGGFRNIFTASRLAAEAWADGAALADPAEGFGENADVRDMYNRVNLGAPAQVGLFDNHIFRSGYFGVGFANGAIDFIYENDRDPYPDAQRPDEIDRIEGELRFVRAYAYYWIARLYLPAYPNSEKLIPFRTEQAANFDEAVLSELASADDIYPFIVNDLEMAVDMLPERYDPELHPVAYADGRATKFSAAALLAKVLFHMRRFDDAKPYLDMVIDDNDGDYDLSEEPIETWNKTGPVRGKEVLWYYAAWAGDGLGGSSNWKHPGRFQEFNASTRDNTDPVHNAQNNGGRYMVFSDAFLEAVGWQNPDGTESAEALNDLRYTQLTVRFEAGNDPRDQFATTRPYVWNNKYYRSGVRRSTNVVILRLADMYLLRATIRAMENDFGGARSDLNAVRNRAGLADFAGADNELMDAIMIERFREMAFEGDRLYYLQALQMDIPEGDRTTGSVPWNSTFYSQVPLFEQDFNEAYFGN